MKSVTPIVAIQKGLDFIASTQKPDGSFESFSSAAQSPFRSKLTYQTVFAPALILSSLSVVDTAPAITIRQKLATWLTRQKSPHWSFNYWAKGAPERQTLPYPDDLDDTFCALIALQLHDSSIIDPTCLGNVVKLLLAAEQQVGGPYRTWLVNEKAPNIWRDIDVAVNSNVACFLGMVAESTPTLIKLMEQAITSKSFSSPYYPTPYPIMYYLARAYRGPLAGKLADYILTLKRDDWWGNSLNNSLAISSLTMLGKTDEAEKAAQHLINQQLPNGSWPAEAFCIDPAVKGKKYYNGSATLTTAFAINALATQKPKKLPAVRRPSNQDKISTKLYDEVFELAVTEAKALKPELRRRSLDVLGQMRRQDSDKQIVLLAHFFNQSLVKPAENGASTLLLHLGAANLYGWSAYTIYDDILDNDPQPQLLSVANVSLRQSIRHFALAVSEQSFQKLVWESFDQIDAANAWELEHCRMQVTNTSITIDRLPTYQNTLSLADRSLGHTLPAIGVLAAVGLKTTDKNAGLVHLALRHYLVARQLNDDLHDWEEDLRSGIITYVVAALFNGLDVRPGAYKLAQLVPKMQRQFWGHTLFEICKTIRRHTSLARRDAAGSRLLASDNIIQSLTAKIDETVDTTLKEQSRAEKFLASFSSKTPK